VIRPYFTLAPEDPMYDSYPVREDMLDALRPYLADKSLDLQRFDYFLEFDRDD
jgi:hypothetical protein